MNNLKFLLLIIALGCFFQSGFSQVGINTATPPSMLDINWNLSIKTVNYNSGPSGSWKVIIDGIYLSLSPSGLNVEFALTDSNAVHGRMYYVRNILDFNAAKLYKKEVNYFSKKT